MKQKLAIECKLSAADLNADYLDIRNCPMCKAVFRQIGSSNIKICINEKKILRCWIDDIEYSIDNRGQSISDHLCLSYYTDKVLPDNCRFSIHSTS